MSRLSALTALLLFVLLGLGVLPSALAAPDEAVFGRLSWSVGDVYFREKGQSEWTPVQANMPLSRNFELRTGKESRAELEVLESVQRLNEMTEISLAELDTSEDGLLEGVLQLIEGSVYTVWKNLSGAGVRVRSSNAVMAIRGTTFRAEAGQSSDLSVWVYEGQVDVNGDPGSAVPPPVMAPRASNGPPKSKGGPKSVAGPKSVSLKEWIQIREGMQLVVHPDGRATLQTIDRVKDRESEWVRWNEERDLTLPRD